MINLTEELFVEAIHHEKDHLKYVDIPKEAHYFENLRLVETPDFSFSGDFGNNRAISSYFGKINPGLHLAKVAGKLQTLKPITDPSNSKELDPSVILDDLIRYCEMQRKGVMKAVQDETNGMILGVVGPGYVPVQNADLYTIGKKILDGANIPYEPTFEHDGEQMRINYRFPEMAIELPDVDGKENVIEYRLSTYNGMTGHRSVGVDRGFWEQVCTNGAVVKVAGESWSKAHVGRNVDFFEEFTQHFIQDLKAGDDQLDLIVQANEILEPIIKANEDIVKVLSSPKFRLRVGEAEEVYRRIRTKRQYQRRNGFDMGRAVAEVARDTHNIDRRIELEVIAGRMMLMQIA